MWRKKHIVIWLERKGYAKLALSVAAVAVLLLMLTWEYPVAKTWTHWTLPLSGQVIALDAGHGGADGGAISREGLIEKDVTLAISLYLRDYLQQAGAVVVMTREADIDLAEPETRGYSRRKTQDLLNRVFFVDKHNANLMVSIHLNSIPSSRWTGAQTFYHPRNEENGVLAALVQDEIRSTLQNTNREAKTATTIYLLKATKIPSCLVEVGFLSNPKEARLLADEIYQRKMAEAIYRGILRYTSGERLQPNPSA